MLSSWLIGNERKSISQQEFYVRLIAETAADDGGSPSQSENDLKASYERERERALSKNLEGCYPNAPEWWMDDV